MHFKKGFSKQVSFKAPQSSTSSPLVKTRINVLYRQEYTLVGNLAVCHSAIREPSVMEHWAVCSQRALSTTGVMLFYINTAAKLLASVFLCVISVLLFFLAT